ncbi:putative glucose transporter [Danaus plexippus plexippus]|uniref:Glucose transporter n=1 Tax=Danaus plexippus plexippus TaxID=278856 RepID=A0A212FET9_DANPL|nr:putative glucose transporter [Danaus plexippus plexippus]
MKVTDIFNKLFVTNEHQHLTSSNEYKAGWSFYLVLAGVVTTLGSSLPVGYNIGVVNTPAEILKNFCNESFISRYDLPLDNRWLNVLWSAVVSTFIVGGCIGSLLGSVLADKLGRKKATISTNILFISGGVLFVSCRAADSVEMMIAGRFLVGLAGGLTTSIVPMYLAELAPPSLTGAMGVACPMGVNVGVLVGQVMGLDSLLGGPDNWPYLLSCFMLLVVFSLPVLCVLPESPKYLFVVKRDEVAALNELSRVRGESVSRVSCELESLRLESSSRAGSLLAALRDPALRLPLLLVCAAQAGQQTSGINAVFYYSQSIFRQAGLSEHSSQLASISCGAINVCTAVVVSRVVSHSGRRPLLLGSTLAATLSLAALGFAKIYSDAVSWMPFVCMSAVLVYVLVYGLGLGPIPYFIASELFEVSSRSAGMSWGSLANWGGNFVVGMTFPTMRDTLGAYCFLVFAGITGTLFVFLKLYFPETRGKTPAQVAELCSHGFKSRPVRASRLDMS